MTGGGFLLSFCSGPGLLAGILNQALPRDEVVTCAWEQVSMLANERDESWPYRAEMLAIREALKCPPSEGTPEFVDAYIAAMAERISGLVVERAALERRLGMVQAPRAAAGGAVMEAVSVWIEHLRVQAVEAQAAAERAGRNALSWRARGLVPSFVQHAAQRAWARGIIAREARRQYQAAVRAAPWARGGRMAGNATTYSGMGQCLMALERAEPGSAPAWLLVAVEP